MKGGGKGGGKGVRYFGHFGICYFSKLLNVRVMCDCNGVPKSVSKGGGKSVCNSVPMCDGKCVRTGGWNTVGNSDG